nr:galactokinase [Lachnospiraceae bacterium]
MNNGLWTPEKIYGESAGAARARFGQLREAFARQFGRPAERFYRAPGRVELGGNHTDHQGGVTLSAAVDLDMIAAAASRDDGQLNLLSEGYPLISLSLTDTALRPEEKGATTALVRGMLAGFAERDALPPAGRGGLDIYMASRVPQGSGLSSSAAFEILIGTILNDMTGCPVPEAADLARLAQKTENEYFGKPCGLLDQLSCAHGGVISVDFSGEAPWIRRLSLAMEETDYRLFIVLCGAGHENLTAEYAAIPAECCAVAAYFGEKRLAQVPESDFYDDLPAIRKELGDRACLRAIHVYEENRRALAEAMCLLRGNMEGFLHLVRESGRSSAMYLQNIVPSGEIRHQEMLLTLAVCENILRGRGAVRVHGGGFGGTVEAFVPQDKTEEFRERLESLLGPGCVIPLSISPVGGTGVEL